MSFDPQGYSSDPVPPRRPAADEGYSPTPIEPGLERTAARERVLLPGIFLLAISVLNVLWSFGLFGMGFVYSQVPPEAMEKELEKQQPGNMAQLKQMGWKVEDLLKLYTYTGYGGGGVVLVTSLLGVIGAIRMLMLRSYGLALFTAIVTAVPCVSPMACPCLLGMGVGVWAMVVLLNPDVRSAFR